MWQEGPWPTLLLALVRLQQHAPQSLIFDSRLTMHNDCLSNVLLALWMLVAVKAEKMQQQQQLLLTSTLHAQSISLNPHGFRWHQGARACEVHSPAAGGAGLPAQQGGHAPRHQGRTSCLLCKLQQRLRMNLLPAAPAYRGHA